MLNPVTVVLSAYLLGSGNFLGTREIVIIGVVACVALIFLRNVTVGSLNRTR